ncbi:hypothetical protein PTKIN_Ptkin02bG0234400 [Pterospermum kingtungense]
MATLSDVNFLVKGFRGDIYICPLSNPNFSRKQNLVFPEPFSKFGHIDLSSCNGLLFLDDFEGNCLLWNPATGEHKVLPPSSQEKKRHPAVADRFIYCSGFGFDDKTEDYKVVRFLENYFKDEFGYTQEPVQVVDEND